MYALALMAIRIRKCSRVNDMLMWYVSEWWWFCGSDLCVRLNVDEDVVAVAVVVAGLNVSNIKPFLIAWDKTISVLPIVLNRYISSATRHFHCIKSHTVVLTRQNELLISDIVIINSTSGCLVPVARSTHLTLFNFTLCFNSCSFSARF